LRKKRLENATKKAGEPEIENTAEKLKKRLRVNVDGDTSIPQIKKDEEFYS
jgi:hypothetical protein